jgi:hypothetical protein
MVDWERGFFAVLRPLRAAHHKTLSDASLRELYGEQPDLI